MINFLKYEHLNRKVFKEYNSNWSNLSKVKSQVYLIRIKLRMETRYKMSTVFARNLLFNKQVMATDGTEIGTLSNIIIESKGGNIIDLMITPNPNFDTSRYKKVDNYILMSFDSVSAIKDYIIVDKMKARA